jgi:PPOX class probable FMN-dependent enzyme
MTSKPVAPFEPPVETILTSEQDLLALLGGPSDLVVRKQLDRLDSHARAFIVASPFLTIATSGRDGSCDVSPRGDSAGFAKVLGDRQIAIPERPGNKRHDSLRNLFSNNAVGLLFFVPGMKETLRINGRATVVKDAPWFEQMVARGKRPLLSIVVDIEEVFFHCPKAFHRSQLWEPESWPDRSQLPTLGQILKDQINLEQSAHDLDCDLETSYIRTLY